MTNWLRTGWPTLAIMLGASVWGMIWYPLRMLASLGVTGTAASALTSGAGCLFVLIVRRGAIRTVRWHWLLPALALAAGITNLGFVWGSIHGQVMRVLLLFYLTPAWTALFAHFILHERLTRSGVGLAALSLAGAMTMLWSPKAGIPLPANLAEWAGLAGGMGFAMSNVLILKTSRVLPQMKPEMRTATIFGGAALFGACASLFEAMPAPPAGAHLVSAAWLVLGLGFLLASNNMLVQYGLARVPANRASIIMLFELVVTALSAWLFAGEAPGPREWAGGACIVLASALSSWVHRTKALPPDPANQDAGDAEAGGLGVHLDSGDLTVHIDDELRSKHLERDDRGDRGDHEKHDGLEKRDRSDDGSDHRDDRGNQPDDRSPDHSNDRSNHRSNQRKPDDGQHRQGKNRPRAMV